MKKHSGQNQRGVADSVCQPVEKGPELSSFTVVALLQELSCQKLNRKKLKPAKRLPRAPQLESEETFLKSQGRLFGPPMPTDGYVFWLAPKIRTLRLAWPGCQGSFHVQQDDRVSSLAGEQGHKI